MRKMHFFRIPSRFSHIFCLEPQTQFLICCSPYISAFNEQKTYPHSVCSRGDRPLRAQPTLTCYAAGIACVGGCHSIVRAWTATKFCTNMQSTTCDTMR